MTLGEYLRHEREQRSITIEQVASATKVGIRTLHALEADLYAELPAKPFVRGFVTSYCRFVGLDAKEVLAKFDDFISAKTIERPNREAGHSGYAFEKKDGEQQSRMILLIAIFGFIAIGGVAMFFLKPSSRHHHSSHIDKLRAAHPHTTASTLPGATSSANSNSTSVTHASVGTTSNSTGVGSTPPSGTSGAMVAAPTALIMASPVPSAPPSSNSNSNSDDDHVSQNQPVAPQVPPSSTQEALQQPAPQAAAVKEKDQLDPHDPRDPLDSGLFLKSDEVHHKAVFKVQADIWVRYRVDNRPIRKFIIRKGNTLILRAKDQMRFQVSDPQFVTYNYNNRGAQSLSDSKTLVQRQGAATLFFPAELAEKIEKPFDDGKSLPKAVQPKADHISAVPSPGP